MLVLSRKEQEEIVITAGRHRIRLAVVEVNGVAGRVRLGFEAPLEIQINRAEIQDVIDREREAGGAFEGS